ncbi:MAG: P-II family nitrogen regulator [Gemmatimonadetes bacterium]|nr:P-II family nitrogen regulator [Gemmatimonadota bacterium]
MPRLKDVRAVVRTECVEDLVQALRDAEVPRFYVSHVHVLGAGIDPRSARRSPDEGAAYTEKAQVEFLCPADRADDLVELIRERACTGHRGDGVVIVSDVTDVVSVRTGEHDRIALL